MHDETVYKAEMKAPARPRSVWPALLIGGGLVLLSPALLPDELWLPLILLVAPGLLLMWPAYRSTTEARSSLSVLAIAGAPTLLVGLLLLVMGVTHHYGSWAYAWLLLPAAVVAGAMYVKRFEPDHSVHTTGYRVVRALILATMALAIFFELFVFRGIGAWWPLMLIALGGYLWLRDKRS
ncbi:MAG: hypothetical protein RRC07_14215 [Anaerolineae bacterium]|nr:hypothetical protein [Anaerolineae bacterium]